MLAVYVWYYWIDIEEHTNNSSTKNVNVNDVLLLYQM